VRVCFRNRPLLIVSLLDFWNFYLFV
jgi:hypothetical protein